MKALNFIKYSNLKNLKILCNRYCRNKENFVYYFNSKKISNNNFENSQDDNKYFNKEIKYKYQVNSTYEAMLSNYLKGDLNKAKHYLNSIISIFFKNIDNNNYHEYIHFLRKCISLNKVALNYSDNLKIIKDIHQVEKYIHKNNSLMMKESILKNIIYLLNYHPEYSVQYIIQNMDCFPGNNEHYGNFYLSIAYLLQGKNVDKAINILENILNYSNITDKSLLAYTQYNLGIAKYWNLSTCVHNYKDNITYEYIEDISIKFNEIERLIKSSILINENLDIVFKYDDNYEYKNLIDTVDKEFVGKNTNKDNYNINFESYLLSNKNTYNNIREDILGFVLTNSIDNNNDINKEFIDSFNLYGSKLLVLFNNTSDILMNNLGNIYYNIKDYKRAFIYTIIANISMKKNTLKENIYLQNLALLAAIEYKLSYDFDSAKKVFKFIFNKIDNLPPSIDKTVIYKYYYSIKKDYNYNKYKKSIILNNDINNQEDYNDIDNNDIKEEQLYFNLYKANETISNSFFNEGFLNRKNQLFVPYDN